LTGGDAAAEAAAETDAGDTGDCGGGHASAEDNREEPILPPRLIVSLFVSL
jgi:hypothetical protein